MTGYQSKRAAALDEEGMYLVHQTAQPKQEQYKCIVIDNQHPNGIPFEQWVKPLQRTWVGLTDEDIALIDWESLATKKDCAQAIEAALKEKNT